MPNHRRRDSGVWVDPAHNGLCLEHGLSMKPVEVGKVDLLDIAQMG